MRTQRNHEAAPRALHRKYGGVLLAYARRFIGDRAAAEDIVQKTLIRAWRRIDDVLDGEGSVRSWLLTVARNVAFRLPSLVKGIHAGRRSGRVLGAIAICVSLAVIASALRTTPALADHGGNGVTVTYPGGDLVFSVDDEGLDPAMVNRIISTTWPEGVGAPAGASFSDLMQYTYSATASFGESSPPPTFDGGSMSVSGSTITVTIPGSNFEANANVPDFIKEAFAVATGAAAATLAWAICTASFSIAPFVQPICRFFFTFVWFLVTGYMRHVLLGTGPTPWPNILSAALVGGIAGGLSAWSSVPLVGTREAPGILPGGMDRLLRAIGRRLQAAGGWLGDALTPVYNAVTGYLRDVVNNIRDRFNALAQDNGLATAGADGTITSGIPGKCVDDYGGSGSNGDIVDLYDCNGAPAQNWTEFSNGMLVINNRCMDIAGNRTDNGAPVVLWECNGGGNQVWQQVGNNLVNPQSGRCLDVLSSGPPNGTQLKINDCNDGVYQQFILPSRPEPPPPASMADPSVIRVGSTYYSVESDGANIYSRSASSPAGLIDAARVLIWSNPGIGVVWAPELTRIGDRYYVYFAAGTGGARWMYVISSASLASGYGAAQKLALPDDKWAIDGSAFTFNDQLWFVWSGWEGDTNVEQNIYIARMTNPTLPTGARYIISQPRESWERVVGNPFINEAPEAIKDPNGQLHIVYSANGSWSDQYCMADLRLRAGGDPTYVWDWYKSNGCLFGSNRDTMMPGWDPTLYVNGPGHNSFVLLDGDINTSPPAGAKFPLMYHAVPKGTPYSWENRRWYAGAFTWWANITYSRQNVPGARQDTGYSLGFFEDANSPLPPPPPTGGPGQTGIRNQDPSVIRVGSTYYSVESDGNNIYARSAYSVADLDKSFRRLIWSSPKNMPNVWAPKLVKIPAPYNTYVIYFASGDGGAGQRMYLTWSGFPDHGFSDPQRLALPDDKWAVDGTAFTFNDELWFVWSGWEGDTNVEQNIYIAKMNGPAGVTGGRYIISQARESWERVVGNPYINEAPEAIKDPNGQLHIVYSANGSWSDQYCMADLRLRAGGDPTYVWDWYKSNGCLFGSNRDTMMPGWDPTLYVNGPGHNSFVLLDGDINTSPPAGPTFPLMYHAVPKGTPYNWDNRYWYHGTFTWWGNITYSRCCVPGDNSNTGWSLKFFE